MKLVLTATALLLIAASISWCCVHARTRVGLAPDSPGTSRVELAQVELDPTLGADEQRASAVEAGESVAEETREPDDDELLRELRAISRAWAAGDPPAIERTLEVVIGAPRTPLRVITRIQHGGLASDAQATEGAILALGFTAARWQKPGPFTSDGGAFTRRVLEAIPEIAAPEQEELVEFLAGLTLEDRPVIGAQFLSLILDLRRRFPEQRAAFSPLLEAIARQEVYAAMTARDLDDMARVFAESADPLEVRAVLDALLVSNPDVYLPLAEEEYLRSRNAPELRAAIATAIAARAPVAQAAASLARIADERQLAQLEQLGARRGGLEALQQSYSDLAASDARPLARKILVAGMGAEREDVLVGIATTDSDAAVRTQALLTLTARGGVGESTVSTLRTMHAARSDPRTGLETRSAVSIAGNVALHSQGKARDEAVAFLRDVAGDPTSSSEERGTASEKLKRYAPEVPGDHDAILKQD